MNWGPGGRARTGQDLVQHGPTKIRVTGAKYIYDLCRITNGQKQLRGVAECLEESKFLLAPDHGRVRRILATFPRSSHLCIAKVHYGFQPRGAVLKGVNWKESIKQGITKLSRRYLALNLTDYDQMLLNAHEHDHNGIQHFSDLLHH